jgi:hypothetical protein
MYDYSVGPPMDEGKEMYRRFLSNAELFNEQARRLSSEWPISCEHFLTKDAMNRVAWIGQAAMCIHSGLSRRYRGGFHLLDAKQKISANRIAIEVLTDWKHEYSRKNTALHWNLEAKGIFG